MSTDELTGVQAIERKQPGLPLAPGKVERREFEYTRHGTRAFILSRDVVTGKLLAPHAGPTRTEEDFLAHVQAVVATDPKATRWHFVCDNLNIHQSESLVRWIAQRQELTHTGAAQRRDCPRQQGGPPSRHPRGPGAQRTSRTSARRRSKRPRPCPRNSGNR